MNTERKQALEQGLKTYSIGKSCSKNHMPVERYTLNGSCVQCMYERRHTPENKEAMIEYNKNYHNNSEVKARRHKRYNDLKTDPQIWDEYRKKKSGLDREYRERPDIKEYLLQQKRDYYQRPGVKERAAEQTRERWKDPTYRQKKLEEAKTYQSLPEIKERNKLLAQERAKQNPELYRLRSAFRRASQRQRTPKWISREDRILIRNIYKECVSRCETQETAFEVDHVVPLINDRVSGLHIWWNLQSIPACENNSKSNRFTEQDAEDNGIWYGADYYVNGWVWSTS